MSSRRRWQWPHYSVGSLLLAALPVAWAVGLLLTGAVPAELMAYVDREVVVRGEVMDDIDVADDGMGRIKLKNLLVATGNGTVALPSSWFWFSVSGQSLERQPIARGDTVTVSGKLGEGFGPYSGSIYRGRLESVTAREPPDLFLKLRDWFAARVKQGVPETEAALGLGYLLGQKTNLGGRLAELLKVTGLTHIVVASGANLTILTGTLRKATRRSRLLTLLGSLALVGSFIALVGASSSMVRAGIVSVISLFIWYFGRDIHPGRLLLFVAAITLGLQPRYLLDLGWQLSMGSFAGIMLLSPILSRFFYGRKTPGAIGGLVIETMSASLMTLPLILQSAGYYSLVSLVANLLVLPVIPFAMLFTLLSGMLPWLFGAGAGLLATLVLKLNLLVIEIFGGMDWALYEVAIDWPQVALLYAVLGGVFWLLKRRAGVRLLEPIMVEYADDS